MKIEANKAIGWVAKIHGMDFVDANLPWHIESWQDITGEYDSVIKDSKGKPVIYFSEESDADFSGEDLCALVNMFAEIRETCGETMDYSEQDMVEAIHKATHHN